MKINNINGNLILNSDKNEKDLNHQQTNCKCCWICKIEDVIKRFKKKKIIFSTYHKTRNVLSFNIFEIFNKINKTGSRTLWFYFLSIFKGFTRYKIKFININQNWISIVIIIAMNTLPSNTKDISRELWTNDLIEIIRGRLNRYEMVFVWNIEICNWWGRVSYCFWEGSRDTVMMFMWLSGY